MAKKHQLIEVEIEALRFPDCGVGTYEDKRVIVKQALPGERLCVRVFKVKSGEIHAKPVTVLRRSPLEIAPACRLFGQCGGCAYQHITYEQETAFKRDMVLALIEKVTDAFEFCGFAPAESQTGYRNKMEYSFGDEEKDGALCLGMRKRGTYYEAVDVRDCRIAPDDFGKILRATLLFFRQTGESFYHRIKQTGTLRNLVLRKGFSTGEILVNLVTADGLTADLAAWTQLLLSLDLSGATIKGVLHTLSNSPADAVKPEELRVLYGQDYFMENLLGLRFKVSPFSFFQTNTRGAEALYETVRDFAGDSADKVIFDLYCGTGTIAQIVAEGAKKVIGIELVAEAVAAAKENARLNRIHNCEFIAGDVLAIVDTLSARPDTIILDPPREGLNPKAITKIIAWAAETIVYISCKPSSLAHDLTVFLANGYTLQKIKCHDLFPRTGHVETVALLRSQT